MTVKPVTTPVETIHLRLCPFCKGEEPARAKCPECKGAGMFDDNSEPFFAPPPFDGWTPERLVALSAASRQRGRDAGANDRPPRLTLSQIVEMQLHAMARGGQEHSTVELVRNAKGDTQVKVSVRTGEGEAETVEQARMKAQEQYDHLCKLYPMAPVTTK